MRLKAYRAALLLSAVARLFAGPTHIHDSLPPASDGTASTGAVLISWPAFTGTDGAVIRAGQRAIAINSGILDVTLPANSNGVNYTATFNLYNQKTFTQFWHVPDSTPTLTLASVIVTRPSVGALNGSYRVDPTTISPAGGSAGQVLTLNSLLQWVPAPAPASGSSQGSPGPQGPQGDPGPKGDPGTPGAIGPQGVPGQTGAPGAQGPQGDPGASGFAGPQGPAGPNNNLGGKALDTSAPPADGQVIAFNGTLDKYQPTTLITEESRKLRVSELQPVGAAINLPAGGTAQLISQTGPGNITMIQLAVVAIGGAANERDNATINATIQICTNGEAVPCQHADLGTFFLLHGVPAPPFSFSDNFAVTEYQNGTIGAYRRIMIPYANGVTISLINGSATVPAQIYSQVYYYAGTPGPNVTGSRRKSFHMATTPFVTVNQFAPIDLVNTVGRGQIEGIHLFVFKQTTGLPSWLEGDVTWNMDGVQANAGGTEDFFGGQFYWGQLQFGTDSWGVMKNGAFPGGYYATGMYRLFNKDPLVFDSSFKMTWHNGQLNQSTVPGPVLMSSIIFYYLDR